MATGDYYQINSRQTFTTTTLENVYFYESLDAGTSSDELAQLFIDDVLPSVRAVQSSEIVHVLVKVENLFNPSDFTQAVINFPGTFGAAVDALPPHDAISFTLRPSTKIVRPGGKRYAGLTEQSQDNGVIADAALVILLEALRFALIEILKDLATGLDDHYRPIIVKRILEGVEPDITYRLPENQGEAQHADVIQSDYSLFVRTQNSRRLGN